MITQEEYNITKQQQRELYIKINLLNYNFQLVDELSGVVTGNPTFTVDSNSDMRRSCSLVIVPKDSSFDIKKGSKIWMDKYFSIYVGIKSIFTDEIIYSKIGTYINNNPNQSYNATNNTISIQGIDMMGLLNGTRKGKLKGISYVIPEGSNVREVVISCLKEASINKYIIEDFPITIPYDIRVEVGGTFFDILSKIRDLLPNYQMYFDIDGIFHFDKIPDGKNEQIFIDDDIWKNNLINYSKNVDYSQVKNYIEVFGKTHEVNYFGDKATIEGDNIYCINLPNLENLENILSYTKIGFTTDKTLKNPKLKIKDRKGASMTFSIYNEDDAISNKTYATLDTREGEDYFVVRYIKNNAIKYFQYMSKLQPHAIIKEENKDSPFYVNGTLGEIREILSGGIYDTIYTQASAEEMAKWELYSRCKLKDNITLTCVPIYWADVNKVISITLPNKQTEKEETNLYIIKNINTSFGVTGTQTITCMKYYPYYDNI